MNWRGREISHNAGEKWLDFDKRKQVKTTLYGLSGNNLIRERREIMCFALQADKRFDLIFSSSYFKESFFFLSDYVYFENSSSNPYLIRRIEELNKVNIFSIESLKLIEFMICLI